MSEGKEANIPLYEEKWSCDVCGTPCTISIIYGINKYTADIGSKFRRRGCPCDEDTPDWQLIKDGLCRRNDYEALFDAAKKFGEIVTEIGNDYARE